MWIIEVPSEGDLTNDKYHIVHNPCSSYCDDFGNEPRFMDALDVKLRKELIVDCIQRLANELKFINDHENTDLYDFAGQYLSYDYNNANDEFC